MMIGQLITNGSGTPLDVYTPWLPVRGKSCNFLLNVLDLSLSGGGKLEFKVETKFTTETDGAAVSAGTTATTSSTGVVSIASSTDMKQLCRCLCSFDVSAGSSDWAVVQTLDPIWEPSAA